MALGFSHPPVAQPISNTTEPARALFIWTAMPNVAISPPAKFSSALATGAPLVGGKLYTYLAGTSTPQDTYTDFNGNTANLNPVILDSRGEADVWLEQGVAYKFILTDSADVPVWTVDGINFSGAGGQTFLAADGTNTAPSYAFSNSTGMGLYRISNNVLGIATASSEAVRIDASQNVGVGVTPIAKLDVNGTFRARGAVTVTTGGLTVTAGGLTVTAGGATVTAGGLTVSAGGATIDGNTSITGGTFASRGFTDNATAQAWNLDSSGRLRNNGDTQLAFSARRTTNQTSSGNVIFNDASFSGALNRATMYDTSTGVATVPSGQDGDYLVMASVELFNGTGAGTSANIELRLNGSAIVTKGAGMDNGATGSYVWATVLHLNAGDTITVNSASTSATLYVNAGALFSMRQLG